MKSPKPLLQTLVLSSTLLATCAVASVYEDFNYTANADLDGNSSSGAGFSGAWDASSVMDVFDYTWSKWAGYIVLADKAIGPENNGAGGVVASRTLASSIDSEAAKTVYFSYTFNPDVDDAGWTNFMLRVDGSDTASPTADNLFFQYNGNDFKLRGEGVGPASALVRGQDYLVVGRATFATGQDSLEFSVFSPGDDLSVLESGFQFSATPTMTGVLDELSFRINNSSRVGNVRIGDSLQAVGYDPSRIIEGFDYPAGPLDANNGGNGFSEAWDDLTSTSDKMSVIDHTWSTWLNYQILADKAARPDDNGFTGIEANRQLNQSIDSETAQTVYFSYTFNGDSDDAGWTNFMLRSSSGNTGQSDANNFFIQYSGNTFHTAGNAGLSSDTRAVADGGSGRGVDYLIVGKVDFAPGQDAASLSVFAPGEDAQDVYTAFEVSGTPTVTGTLTELLVRINNSSMLGNIRFGSSLEEVGITPPPPPPSRDPVVYFSFDSGTVANGVVQDLSGNDNHGTLENLNGTVLIDQPGALAEALFFPNADAGNGAVTLPAGVVPAGNSARTFTCWFRQIFDPEVDNVTAQNKIFGYGSQSADPGTTGLESFDVSLRYDYTNSENDIHIRGWGGVGVSSVAGARFNDLEDWNHLAIVVPEGATTMGDVIVYIDGVALTNNNITQLLNTGDTLFSIGTVISNGTSANDYNGYIDEFYVYDVALTSGEIATIAADIPGDIPGHVESFVVSPRNRVPAGTNVTLNWDVDRATSVTIDNGVGDVTAMTDANGQGSITFAAPSSSTTYTLTMTDVTTANYTESTTVVVGNTSLPNVILFLVDDMGWADWEHNRNDTTNGDYATTTINTGSTFYETPHMNSLAQEGIWFRRAYADSPVCSPTRAAIITGQAVARNKVSDWIDGRGDDDMDLFEAEWNRYLTPEMRENSIASVLQDNGFRTIQIGKWHLGTGGSASDTPLNVGFDINIAGGTQGTPPTFFADEDGSFDLVGLRDGSYPQYTSLTDAVTQETLNEIESAHNDGDAFFIHLSHFDPHSPTHAPKAGADYFEAKLNANGGFDPDGIHPVFGGQQNSVYASKMQRVDDSLGSIIAKLEELEIDDETLVIFYSDNGGWEQIGGANVEGTGGSDSKRKYYGAGSIIGETSNRQVTDNAPLHMGKGYLYEGGIRVPSIFWLPGQIAPAQISDDPIITRDLYSTILEITGTPMPAGHTVDGQSITPLLGLSSGDFERPEGIAIHYPHQSAQGGLPGSVMINGNWKLIHYYNYGGRPAFNRQGLSTPDPGYDEDGDDSQQVYVLYDLANDIGETTDLSSSESALQAVFQYDLINGLTLYAANYPRFRISNTEVTPSAGTNPDSTDVDGDGLSAREEAYTGSLDTDADEGFGAALELSTDPSLQVSGKKGRTYRLYRSTTLEADSWVLIQTVGPLAIDGTVQLSDLTAGGLGKAFYRVELSLQ